MVSNTKVEKEGKNIFYSLCYVLRCLYRLTVLLIHGLVPDCHTFENLLISIG